MAFTPANLEKAREIIARYPHKKSAMLPLLHLAQDQDGWVTPEAMEEVAELLDLTPALVLGTCSFYTMFKREPVGKLIVSVCTNVSCLVNRGPELLDHLERRYADDPDVARGRGGVHRRVRPRAGDPGELRVPRAAHARFRRLDHRGVQERRASRAHDLGIAARCRTSSVEASDGSADAGS